jgi:hypothetical protein
VEGKLVSHSMRAVVESTPPRVTVKFRTPPPVEEPPPPPPEEQLARVATSAISAEVKGVFLV